MTTTSLRGRGVVRVLALILQSLVLLQSSHHHHSSVVVVVHAQQQQQNHHPVAVPPEGLIQTNGDGGGGDSLRCVGTEQEQEECLLVLDGSSFDDASADEQLVDAIEFNNAIIDDDDDEEDPMLQLLPGTNKKVYVRADIASFYRKEPGISILPSEQRQPKLTANMRNGGDSTIQRKEQQEESGEMLQEKTPKFRGQAGKFVNMSPERVQLYWNGGHGKSLVFIANIGPFQAGGTATFPQHQFLLTKRGKQDDVLCDFFVKKDTAVYYYNPYVAYNETDHDDVARCVPRPDYANTVREISQLSPNDQEKYQAHVYNLEFGALYKNFTGGSEWLSMFPRNPPRHQIYRADYFGQQHTVSTREMHFITEPPELAIDSSSSGKKKRRQLSMEEMRRNDSDPVLPFAAHRALGTSMNLTLTAISCAPRAFEIQNFLSDVEVDHILALVAQQHTLERSTTGGHLSDTRTSTTTWIPRQSDHIVNAVIRRAADVLRLDEALLRHRDDHDENPAHLLDNDRPINEDMQIVHYDPGQEYTAHHDFGYYNGLVDSPTRSINVALYLNDVDAGGETIFPRWRNAETTDALKVKPVKGKALIFFMTLPDGNLDDLTQHAALPVIRGEKYFANLWLHDPYNR